MAKMQARDPRLNRPPTGPNRAARRRGKSSRPWWRHPAAILGLLVVLGVIGVLIQSHRSGRTSGTGQRPAHGQGPGGSEVIGAAGAPVLVEVYSDFECRRCGQFQRTVEPQIRKLVDEGKVRMAYYVSLTKMDSLTSANASICAGEQGAFWPYHDYLFAYQLPENSGSRTPDQLIQFGRQVGINSSAFDACVKDGTYNGWVYQINAQGGARGIRILPAIFVNGRVLSDPFSALTAIQEALKVND